MRKSSSSAADRTPAKPPPSLKKANSSASADTKQRFITGFFKKPSTDGTPTSSNGVLKPSSASANTNTVTKPTQPIKKPAFKKSSSAFKNATPVPSSDAAGPSSSQENDNGGIPGDDEGNDMPTPTTPAKRVQQQAKELVIGSSPSRKVRGDIFKCRRHLHEANGIV